MENRAHALAAGLFVLVLTIASVAALFWFGGKREVTRELIVVTRQNVTGLNPQSQVRYRGIPVGKVKDIRLDPKEMRDILITIEVKQELPLTEGTTARLGYQGVTGLAHVLLEDSGTDADKLIADSGHLPRIQMQPSLLQELSDSGAGLLREAKEVVLSLKAILNEDNRKKINLILTHLEKGSQGMKPAMDNLNASLAGLRKVLSEENAGKLARAMTEAGPLMSETRGLVVKLQAVSDKLDRVIGEPTTQGAAALMPRLNEVAGEVAVTTRQLNRVLKLLEESPQSLIFGVPPAQPGPGEPGFVAPDAAKGER